LALGQQKVSIVITAYNNETTIAECLETLYGQSYAEKELIVVCDTRSSDKTIEAAQRFVDANSGSRMLLCTGVGRSEARNIGWRSSDCPILMFADGDDVYKAEYLSQAVEALLASDRTGGVCVGGEALVTENTLLQRYYRSFGPTDSRASRAPSREPDWAWVYRRECLEQTGGFDPRLAQAEDKDLCGRVKSAGFLIGYVSGVNWYHRKPDSVSGFLKKEYVSGKRRVGYELKNTKYLTLLFGALLVPVISVLILAVLVLMSSLLAVVILLFGASYMIWNARKRSQGTNSPSDSLFFAVLAMAGRLSEGMGTLYGLVLHGLSRSGALKLDLGRV
jgi:glycosyltransferase involved in cell wall biosynthesis